MFKDSKKFIEFRNVSFKFADRFILKDISTTINSGKVTALIGRNGAGKTTFLKLSSGILKPSNGDVFLGDISLSNMTSKERALNIGVVQQLPFAPDEMKVRDLVMLGRYPHLGLFAQESKQDMIAVEDALKKVECLSLAFRTMGSLSGGEKRKIFIARALAQNVDIFLIIWMILQSMLWYRGRELLAGSQIQGGLQGARTHGIPLILPVFLHWWRSHEREGLCRSERSSAPSKECAHGRFHQH